MIGGSIGAFSDMVLAGVAHGLGKAWGEGTGEGYVPRKQTLDVAGAARDAIDDIRETRFPTDGEITSPFGPRPGINGGQHAGVDLGADMNTPIRAVESGRVKVAFGRFSIGNSADVSHHYWGRHTILDHGTKHGLQVETLYAHENAIHVSAGTYVARGSVIGLSGNSGGYLNSVRQWITPLKPHVHFAIRVNGSFVDPEQFDWMRWRLRP